MPKLGKSFSGPAVICQIFEICETATDWYRGPKQSFTVLTRNVPQDRFTRPICPQGQLKRTTLRSGVDDETNIYKVSDLTRPTPKWWDLERDALCSHGVN